MADELAGRTVGILVAPGSSDADVEAVRQALAGVGARPVAVLVGGQPRPDGWDARRLEDAVARDFDGLVVPGGIAGADVLRADDRAVSLVREAFLSGATIGTLGHGAWVLVEADIATGRTVAAAPGLRTGLRNAGGTLAAEGVRAEPFLVTARGSEELAAFVGRLVEALRAQHGRKARPPERESRVDRMVEQSFPASDPAPGPSYI